MWHTFIYKIVCSLMMCSLGLSLTAQEKAKDVDDRFDSANQATKVSPPALSQKAPFDVPFRVRYSDLDESELLPASNLVRLAEMENRDTTVVGTVDSAFIPRGNNKVILNFSKDHRNCFKAVIDIRDFEKWGTNDPQQIGRLYEGKTLAVSGLLTMFQEKPQILIGLPHQLPIIVGK
ncbi:MAG: hypothetical protein KF851_06720 [Pirellulaceae bacterium]|nr:hypothetical protein [Pirellulaceae bacterium]